MSELCLERRAPLGWRRRHLSADRRRAVTRRPGVVKSRDYGHGRDRDRRVAGQRRRGCDADRTADNSPGRSPDRGAEGRIAGAAMAPTPAPSIPPTTPPTRARSAACSGSTRITSGTITGWMPTASTCTRATLTAPGSAGAHADAAAAAAAATPSQAIRTAISRIAQILILGAYPGSRDDNNRGAVGHARIAPDLAGGDSPHSVRQRVRLAQ